MQSAWQRATAYCGPFCAAICYLIPMLCVATRKTLHVFIIASQEGLFLFPMKNGMNFAARFKHKRALLATIVATPKGGAGVFLLCAWRLENITALSAPLAPWNAEHIPLG